MVLFEFGQKIAKALQDFSKAPLINEDVIRKCLNDIGMALLQADVSIMYVKRLKDNILNQFKINKELGANLQKVVQRSVVEELTKMLEADRKPFEPKRGKTNIVMFVGLQGSGKTTTCTKYAYHYARKNIRVALVCADTFRAGAFDQLKQNATKIRVPYYGSNTETDPVVIAKEGVDMFRKEGFELIIVDTSGRHMQEKDLFDEMKMVEQAVKPTEVIFVMDSSIGQQCYAQAEAFKKAVNVGSVIVTKLDGHAKGGGALSAVAATQSPILFIGQGEHFTDFEQFEAASFIKRLLGLGDLGKMVEIVKDVMTEGDQKKMMGRIQEGKFSYRDLKTQYSSVLKLGPLNQFASLIPGLGQQLMSQGGSEKENIDRVKRQICILDSMNDQELDGDKPLTEDRKRKIARGSGTTLVEIDAMVANYTQIKRLIEKFGKTKMGNTNDALRNPKQIMSQLGSVLKPDMIEKMGGMDNIMGMVKQLGMMEKKGELKDFNDMMKTAPGKKKK